MTKKKDQSDPAKSLGALVQESLMLSQRIADALGELTPEIEAALAVNSAELATKLDSYVYVEDQFDAQLALWKRKADVLYAVADRFKKAKERLRENIKFAMGELGVKEIKGRESRFLLVDAKPRLVINEKLISSEFKKEVTELVIDKEKIRAVLEDGFEVEGASLELSQQLRTYENTEV